MGRLSIAIAAPHFKASEDQKARPPIAAGRCGKSIPLPLSCAPACPTLVTAPASSDSCPIVLAENCLPVPMACLLRKSPIVSRRGPVHVGGADAGGTRRRPIFETMARRWRPRLTGEGGEHAMSTRKRMAAALAAGMALAFAGAGAGAGRGDLRHQLGRRGRAWRLLPGGRRRHLREIRPEGHHHPEGRAGACCSAARSSSTWRATCSARSRRRRAGHPGDRGRRDLPEGSADPHGPPGSRA